MLFSIRISTTSDTHSGQHQKLAPGARLIGRAMGSSSANLARFEVLLGLLLRFSYFLDFLPLSLADPLSLSHHNGV